jgi:1,4-dihydroxy-2-naphthoate octaprenyltransferase
MVIVYGTIVLSVFARIFPVSTLLALLTMPMALKVRALIKGNMGNPYGLIPAMSLNIKLYVVTTLLLMAGYLLSLLLHV